MAFNNWATSANGASATIRAAGGGASAANIIDGDDATYSAADAGIPNSWVAVDCGQARRVASFRLRQRINSENFGIDTATAYKLQKSDNGTDWTDVLAVSSPDITSGNDYLALTVPVSARYWRLLATAGYVSGNWRVFTFELWSMAVSSSSVFTEGSGKNVAIWGCDGSDSSNWRAIFQESAGWLAIDCVDTWTFTGYRLLQGDGGGNFGAPSYKVQTSTDGSTWVDVYTRAATAPADQSVTFSSPASGRYIRILAVTRAPWYWCIYEFAPAGEPAAAEPPAVGGGRRSIHVGIGLRM